MSLEEAHNGRIWIEFSLFFSIEKLCNIEKCVDKNVTRAHARSCVHCTLERQLASNIMILIEYLLFHFSYSTLSNTNSSYSDDGTHVCVSLHTYNFAYELFYHHESPVCIILHTLTTFVRILFSLRFVFFFFFQVFSCFYCKHTRYVFVHLSSLIPTILSQPYTAIPFHSRKTNTKIKK